MNFNCSTIAALATAVAVIAIAPGCSSNNSPRETDGGSPDAARPPIDGQSDDSCSATAKQGSLQGKLAGTTCEYLGIRYGAPPMGALRFMPPQPADSWQGTLDATKFGNVCEHPPQGAKGNEDCLFLNVYTPRHPSVTPLPVMAFIHGGGFGLGSSSAYDAQALSEAGPVVVVTMNYRLGALGFFALPELDAERRGAPSGSDGIRDQQLALKWIRDNAPFFGGDPSNVTVFGESAGSTSACLHLVSPGSRGLARRFILESNSCVQGGVGYSTPATQASAYALSRALATALCPNADAGSDVMSCLRAADPSAIMAWVPAAGSSPSPFVSFFGAPFYPVVEGAGGVLPDTPENLIRAGNYDTTAGIVAGTNAHEWGLFSVVALGTSNTDLQVTTAAQLKQLAEQQFGDKAAQVLAQYPVTDATASDVNIQAATDAFFRCPTRALARLTTAHGTGHFYLYSFEFDRAYHSDELATLFPNLPRWPNADGTEPMPPTAALATAMRDYWTEMAATGAPSGPSTPVRWPSYTASTDEHLVLDDPPSTGAHLGGSNCDFWDNLNGFAPP